MPIAGGSKQGAGKDARQTAYQALKDGILNLRFLPGAKLSEAELATLLHMSRTPVRAMLARLTRENLVEQIPQRGAFVIRLDPARVKQSAWLLSRTGIAVLDALYVEHVSAQQFLLLHHIVEQMGNAVKQHNFSQSAGELIRFHAEMYRLARFELAWDAMQRVTYDFHRVIWLAADSPALWEGTLLECHSIAESLTQRNNAQASHALCHQMNRICEIAESLRQTYPDYFVAIP